MNSIINTIRNSSIDNLNRNNELLTEGVVTANAFNNYFVDLVLPGSAMQAHPTVCLHKKASVMKLMFFFHMTCQEVSSAFHNLTNGKVHDVNNLQLLPITFAIDLTAPPLEHTYVAFDTGIFLKVANG